MKHKKYIIIGFDYTSSGEKALEFAYQFALKTGYGLEVFHLFDFPVIYSNSGLYFIDYREIRKNDEEKLKSSVFKIIPEDSPIDIRIRSTFISMRTFTNDITKNTNKYAVLILGYHSRKGIFEKLSKSSGIKLSGEVNIPLLIVKDANIFQYPEQERNAVVLVDNKKLIRASLLKKAENFCEPLGMKIELVHIHTDEEWPDIYEYNYTKDFKKWNVQEIRARDFESGLNKLILRKKPEMMVVFSEKHNGLYKMFRQTHTEKVANKAKHLILSIQI